LEADAKAQLWRLALSQQQNTDTSSDQIPLLVALARHCGNCSASAAAEGQWAVMREQLQEAVTLYLELSRVLPEQGAVARQELGNLIGKLMADLHASVHSDQPPGSKERAELCWHGFQLGQIYRQLQLEMPDWLWHLDEQLTREGAIGLRELVAGEPPQEAEHGQRKALELLLHLGRLHQPCPEWILLAACELLEQEIERLLAGEDPVADPRRLQQLLGLLARLPLPAERLGPVQLAAQRGIWSLQLLAPRLGTGEPSARPQAMPSPQPSAAVPSEQQALRQTPKPPAAQPAAPLQPRQLYDAIRLAVSEWLADNPAGLRTHRLEPVLRPGEAPVLPIEGGLQLNLSPLLSQPQVELLDQLVPAFFEPLQQAGRGAELQLVEPHSALWPELLSIWQSGAELSQNQWRGLVYTTALWTRCGGRGGLEARELGWSLPVAALQNGQCLLRPGNVELAALQTVLMQRDDLGDFLSEIRRRHHDRGWMEAQRDSWWYDPSDGSENLRRLHTNAGFYASSHAPLESLQRWGQATLRALLSGPVLFGNASITEMFWPVAQHLARRAGKVPALVQWPGDQSFYDFIAGQEVLFVTPLASDVEAHHRTGLAFQLFTDITIQPYGLRCIEAPISIYPNRPERGFEDSLDRALEQVDRAFRQKRFSVFTAACGAYGLPLCEAVHQRYGVSCVYVGNLMHAYFGVLQRTTQAWRAESRINDHWVHSSALDGVPGVDRVEGGRYLS
jgi:hypothetical protein